MSFCSRVSTVFRGGHKGCGLSESLWITCRKKQSFVLIADLLPLLLRRLATRIIHLTADTLLKSSEEGTADCDWVSVLAGRGEAPRVCFSSEERSRASLHLV